MLFFNYFYVEFPYLFMQIEQSLKKIGVSGVKAYLPAIVGRITIEEIR